MDLTRALELIGNLEMRVAALEQQMHLVGELTGKMTTIAEMSAEIDAELLRRIENAAPGKVR